MPQADSGFTSDEWSEIRDHLRDQYAGVFSEDMVEAHLQNHVGFATAEWSVGTVQVCGLYGAGARVLDIGAGFGSFVIRGRQSGWQVFGVEPEPFEVTYAQRRLARLISGAAPADVLKQGSALDLPFEDESFQVATLWNVLEHIDDPASVFREVRRVLVPGGTVYAVCPNYAASRLEAHYHVPMDGLVPRHEMIARLRTLGKDPTFFEHSIFYRTNREVLRILEELGFVVYDLHNTRRMDRSVGNFWRLLFRRAEIAAFHDDRVESVMLAARRPA